MVVMRGWLSVVVCLGLCEPARADLRYEVHGSIAPYTFWEQFGSDSHGPSDVAPTLGVSGAILVRGETRVRLGVGVRYAIGLGDNDKPHFIAVPALVELVPWRGERSELQIVAGAGIATVLLGQMYATGSPFYQIGPITEVAIGYGRQLAGGRQLQIHLGARMAVMFEQNAYDSYLDGSSMVHMDLGFLRAGLAW